MKKRIDLKLLPSLAALLFFFSNSYPIYSQQNPVLNLHDCFKLAEQSSYLLQAGKSDIEAALRRAKIETARNLPQISGLFSAEQRFLTPYSFGQEAALLNADWAFGKYFHRTERAEMKEASALRSLNEQTLLLLKERIASLYINALQNRAEAQMLNKRIELLKAHYEITKALWQSGMRTEFDLLQTEAGISQLQEEIINLKNKQKAIITELIRLIDWKFPTAPTLSGIDASRIFEFPVISSDSVTVLSSPVLKAADYKIEAQLLRKDAVNAALLPTFQLGGGYFTDGDPTGDGNFWLLNAGVSFPLFQWSATDLKKQEITADIKSLQSRKEDLHRELTIRVENTLTELSKIKNIVKMQKDRLALTKKAADLAETNYRAGLLSNLDYLSAVQNYSETEIAIRKSELDYTAQLIGYYILTNQPGKIETIQK